MANVGRTLESAAHFVRGGGTPIPDHDSDNTARAVRLETEQRRLIQWAQENRKLGSNRQLPPEIGRGGEHRVFFKENTQRVIKSTLPDRQKGYGISLGSFTHGATPSEYLDRLALHNQIFDDDVRLERIVVSSGKPIVITSQPFIRGLQAKAVELDDMMVNKGYEKLADGAYYDEVAGLLVFDLFPRNAIQTETGEIFPIDPVIQRITQDFGQFLRGHPNTINTR